MRAVASLVLDRKRHPRQENLRCVLWCLRHSASTESLPSPASRHKMMPTSTVDFDVGFVITKHGTVFQLKLQHPAAIEPIETGSVGAGEGVCVLTSVCVHLGGFRLAGRVRGTGLSTAQRKTVRWCKTHHISRYCYQNRRIRRRCTQPSRHPSCRWWYHHH